MQSSERTNWKLIAGLVLLCAAARLLPHPPNFTPLMAVSLFAGYQLRRRVVAAIVPFAALVASDYVIGGYEPRVMLVVYATLLAPVLLRGLLAGRFFTFRLLGCSLFGSILFFVASNGAVWAFDGWYSPDWSGLVTCYTAGLPFLRNTIAGDLVWNGVLFGGAAVTSTALARIQPFLRACRLIQPAPVRGLVAVRAN